MEKRYIQHTGCEYQYEAEDEFFWLHENDKKLTPTKIPLPKFDGDITKVYNYGLAPEDQTYPYEDIPKRIKNIEYFVRKHFNLKEKQTVSLTLIEQFLLENQIDFRDEIEWIKRVLHHRFHGQWVLINGKLRFINRWHYVFVNFWFVNGDNTQRKGFAEFRSRDWKFFLACEYLYTDTMAVFPIVVQWSTDKSPELYTRGFGHMADAKKFAQGLNGMAVNNVVINEGMFLIDMKTRTCFGILYYKYRREGATYKATCMGFCIVTEGFNQHGAVQSKSDTHAGEVYSQKLVEALKKLPFFLLPEFIPGSKTMFPASKVEFVSLSKLRNAKEMGCSYGAYTSGTYVLDGSRWKVIHHDEIGKKDKDSHFNIIKRYNVCKAAMSTGAYKNIHGWYMGTSTVGDMTGDGGADAYTLAMLSLPTQVNDNGQTSSGLKIVFLKTEDGLEKHIDKFGDSVIEDPIEPILGIDGNWITQGSRSFIQNTIDDLTRKEDWNGLNEFIRQHPQQFMDCFRASNKESQFNVELITRQLEDLSIVREPLTKQFTIRFKNGWGTPAEIEEDNIWGEWTATRIPEPHERNQFILGQEGLQPAPNVIGRTVGGFDPMKNQKKNVSGNTLSNGAGAIYRPYDPVTDNGKHERDWKGGRFELVYNRRVDDKHQYSMSMGAACMLVGALAYPEMNFDLVASDFQLNGMTGYLLHDADPKTGEWKSTPGVSTTNGGVKDDLWAVSRVWVNKFVPYCYQKEVLTEYLNIRNPEEMTYYDLFTACSLALKGAESNTLQELRTESQKSVNLGRFFQQFNYQ